MAFAVKPNEYRKQSTHNQRRKSNYKNPAAIFIPTLSTISGIQLLPGQLIGIYDEQFNPIEKSWKRVFEEKLGQTLISFARSKLYEGVQLPGKLIDQHLQGS